MAEKQVVINAKYSNLSWNLKPRSFASIERFDRQFVISGHYRCRFRQRQKPLLKRLLLFTEDKEIVADFSYGIYKGC